MDGIKTLNQGRVVGQSESEEGVYRGNYLTQDGIGGLAYIGVCVGVYFAVWQI